MGKGTGDQGPTPLFMNLTRLFSGSVILQVRSEYFLFASKIAAPPVLTLGEFMTALPRQHFELEVKVSLIFYPPSRR